jgi:hypothetical protein
MKALLLYPEFPDRSWSFRRVVKFIGERATLPALGLFTVAAMLPEDWEKRLVDVNVRPLRKKGTRVGGRGAGLSLGSARLWAVVGAAQFTVGLNPIAKPCPPAHCTRLHTCRLPVATKNEKAEYIII